MTNIRKQSVFIALCALMLMLCITLAILGVGEIGIVNAEGDGEPTTQTAVVKVGDTEYTSFASAVEAFNALENGGTLTLLDDTIIDSSYTITKPIVFDFAGHKLKNADDDYYTWDLEFKNKTTIKDSSPEKTGWTPAAVWLPSSADFDFTPTDAEPYAHHIEGGAFAYRIRINSHTHVSGGTFDHQAVFAGENIKISGGVFNEYESKNDVDFPNGYADMDHPSVVITGGTFNLPLVVTNSQYGPTNMSIYGGSYKGLVFLDSHAEDNIKIYGGSFENITLPESGRTYEDLIPDGYAYAYENSEGISYVALTDTATEMENHKNDDIQVVQHPRNHVPGTQCAYCGATLSGVAQIGETTYTTISDALQALNDGDTLKLLYDVDLGGEDVAIDKDVTIDLAGCKISGTMLTFNKKATLKDSSSLKTGVFDVKIDFASLSFTPSDAEPYAYYIEGGTFNKSIVIVDNTLVSGGTFKAYASLDGKNIKVSGGVFDTYESTNSNYPNGSLSIYCSDASKNPDVVYVTITGGTFNRTVNINTSPASIHVYGGAFAELSFHGYATHDIKLYGGTFDKITIAGSGTQLKDILGKGYVFEDLTSTSGQKQYIDVSSTTGSINQQVTVVVCPHEGINENGYCSHCAQQAPLKIKRAGNVIYAFTLADCVEMLQDGDEVALIDYIDLGSDTSTIYIKKNITFDVGSYSIKGDGVLVFCRETTFKRSNENGCFMIEVSLTKDDDYVPSTTPAEGETFYQYVIENAWFKKHLTISESTYIKNGDFLTDVNFAGGDIYIEGGTFHVESTSSSQVSIVNCASFTVSSRGNVEFLNTFRFINPSTKIAIGEGELGTVRFVFMILEEHTDALNADKLINIANCVINNLRLNNGLSLSSILAGDYMFVRDGESAIADYPRYDQLDAFYEKYCYTIDMNFRIDACQHCTYDPQTNLYGEANSGYENGVCVYCDHHCGHLSADENGVCNTCKMQTVAQVDGNYYTSFDDAIEAIEESSVMTLFVDFELTDDWTIGVACTIHLNGHNIVATQKTDGSYPTIIINDALQSDFAVEIHGKDVDEGELPTDNVKANIQVHTPLALFDCIVNSGVSATSITIFENSALDCNSNVNIHCAVTNGGIINGGEFEGIVTNNGTISNGKFGTVDNNGIISGGIFSATLNNTATGTVSGGTFTCIVANVGTISGGSFYNTVNNGTSATTSTTSPMPTINPQSEETVLAFYDYVWNYGVIEGGCFYAKAEGAESETGFLVNYGTVKDGTIYSRTSNYGTIFGGLFTRTGGGINSPDVYNNGIIEGGTFYGYVRAVGGEIRNGEGTSPEFTSSTAEGATSGFVVLSATINGGVFNVDVEVGTSATIAGGTFNGTIDNYGKITGGTFSNTSNVNILYYNGSSQYAGVIEDGTFNGRIAIDGDSVDEVYCEIKGGTFAPTDITRQKGIISGGTFTINTSFTNDGKISGGTFTITCAEFINNGTISDGEFSLNTTLSNVSGEMTNNDTISGGKFTLNSTLSNASGATISQGEFTVKGTVTNSGTISNGKFTLSADITNNNWISGGEFNLVSGTVDSTKLVNKSTIAGGTFNLPVQNGEAQYTIQQSAKIKGGTFNKNVVNHTEIRCDDGTTGATFNGIVTNNLTISGGSFNNTVINYAEENSNSLVLNNNPRGKISGGTFSGAVTNDGGTISGGNFSSTILNTGTINGGTFTGAITNNGRITGGAFSGAVTNLAETTLNGQSTGSNTTNGRRNGNIVIDKDTIIDTGNSGIGGTTPGGNGLIDIGGGGSGVSTLTVNGTIGGGTFTGTVTNNGVIIGGTFNGAVVNNGSIIKDSTSTSTNRPSITFGSTLENNGTIEGVLIAGSQNSVLNNYGKLYNCTIEITTKINRKTSGSVALSVSSVTFRLYNVYALTTNCIGADCEFDECGFSCYDDQGHQLPQVAPALADGYAFAQISDDTIYNGYIEQFIYDAKTVAHTHDYNETGHCACGATTEGATHTAGNNSHKCSGCGLVLTDCADENDDHKCDVCGITVSEHTGGQATCTEQATCTICGEKYGMPLFHDVDKDNWVQGDTQHYHACTRDGCNYKEDAEDHTDTDNNHYCDVCGAKVSEHTGGVATCTSKATCTICGNEYGEVDAHNHSHLEKVDAVDATEDKEGNIEHYHCSDCDKYYSDSTATTEISASSVVVEKITQSPETSDDSSDDSTLSAGAWAGIGIAIAVVVAGIVVGVIFLVKAKSKKS